MKHFSWIGPLVIITIGLLARLQQPMGPSSPRSNPPPQSSANAPSGPRDSVYRDSPTGPSVTPGSAAVSGVPTKASEVLAYIRRTGQPMDGYAGGRIFENREHRLPEGGVYREYDVDPKIRGEGRDAERLIVEQDTGHAFYTGDHYRTFIPMPNAR